MALGLLYEIRLFKHSILEATDQLDNFDVGLLRAARISQQKLIFQHISKSRAIVMPLWPTSWLIHQFLPSRFALVATSYLQASLRFASVGGCCDANGWEVWQWQGSDDAPLARQNVPKEWFFWVNYNDLTTTSLEIMVSKGNHPQIMVIIYPDFWSRCGVCFCVMLSFQELNPPDIPWYSCVRVGGLKRGNISGGPEVEPYLKQVGTAGLSDFHSLHGQTLDILCCLASIWN